MMKKGLIAIVIIAAIAIGLYNWVRGTYNNMVMMDGEVQ
jgi:Flp pilus assembly pilin Flp